jgi:hypothetical protein
MSEAVTVPLVTSRASVPEKVQLAPQLCPAPADAVPETSKVLVVSAWALGAAKHKAKTRHNTAPRLLSRLGI